MSQATPLVTVIIPTYNSSGTLRLALDSVLLQDLRDFEVWVVGDGCSDDSAEVVSGFRDSRLHWINLPQNSGSPSAPRNEGLRRAQGSLVAYLGHDDLWFPWHLSELADTFSSHEVQFAYSLGALLGPEGLTGCFSLPKDFSSGGCLSPSNWMHQKSLVDKIGPWPEEYRYGDDREFARRVIATKTRLEFRRQLTVLKYPAAAWRMYALTSDFPQAAELEIIRRNPDRLRLDLLLQFAAMAPGGSKHPQRHLLPLPAVGRRILQVLLDWYGRDRWPVNRFEYWRWRRLAGLSARKAKR